MADNKTRKEQKIEARRKALQEKAQARAGRAQAAGSPAGSTSHAGPADTYRLNNGDAARDSSGRDISGNGTPSAGGAGSSKGSSRAAKPEGPRRKIKWKFWLVLSVVIIGVLVYGGFWLRDYIEGITDIRITDEGFTHAERFSSCVALNGIDVSAHQGEDIKWKKVKSSGADFVFIRAGYRSADTGTLNTDKYFEANMEGAGKAGIMVGAYFYSQALTAGEAEEEADYLLELVRPYDITMPLVIDFEIYPDGRLAQKIAAGEMSAASFYHDIVLAFCRKVEAAGYESAVYANLDMLTHYMQADLLDDSATIWLAQYSESSELEADYWIWQATDSGKVGGISGPVDHDFWYIEPGKAYATRGAGIRNEAQRISIGDCKVSFTKPSYRIKRHLARPKAGITYNGRGMKEGRDYVITAVRNTEPGTGYVIVRGIGRYKDWVMVPFTIE